MRTFRVWFHYNNEHEQFQRAKLVDADNAYEAKNYVEITENDVTIDKVEEL